MERNDNFSVFSGNHEKVLDSLHAMIVNAKVGSAFGEPVTAGDFTVIPAAETTVSLGAGFGIGAGPVQSGHHEPAAAGSAGSGGGGGGGGMSGSRPVATIEIGPHGVAVKPIVDITKLGLALATALGSMLLLLVRMSKGDKK